MNLTSASRQGYGCADGEAGAVVDGEIVTASLLKGHHVDIGVAVAGLVLVGDVELADLGTARGSRLAHFAKRIDYPLDVFGIVYMARVVDGRIGYNDMAYL